MNNANVGSSGAEWVPVACLLAIGALLDLSTRMAKLAGMHGLGALPSLAWSLVGGALILGATAAVRHKRPPYQTLQALSEYVTVMRRPVDISYAESRSRIDKTATAATRASRGAVTSKRRSAIASGVANEVVAEAVSSTKESSRMSDL